MRKAVAEGCVFILVYLFAGATIGSTSANAGFSLAGAAFAAVSFLVSRRRRWLVPHWNAGVVNSVLTSSGVPGYALLTAPLHLAFGKPHLYHALGLAAIHAFLMPWLAVVGLLSALALSAGHTLRPNVQLYRMAVPLALALAVPAAIRAGEALGDANPRSAPLQGAVALLLVFCAVNTVGIYGGEGYAPVEGIAPAVRELAAWISENVPEDGRVAFLGPTGHAYGHAHVAYLPILAGREMMACDYYEFPPSTYEHDFPPRVVRRGPGGIRGYLARHGVSHAVTTRSNYVSFMESRPEEFEQVARFSYSHWTGDSDIRVFEVKGGREGMLRGADGSVKATFNRIDVEFRGEPPERAVVAYIWNPRMRASPPAEIAPAPPAAPGEDPFIEIRPHGAEKARIDYVPRL